MAFNLPEDAINKITLKPREPNRGTPQSLLEAANKNIAFISWEQEPMGITVDKVVKHPDGTKTVYFTSNCDIKKSVPHVAQHDLDTCCGTTANNVQNLAYVKQLEDKVKFMDSLIEAHQCDTLYQFARHVSMLAVRCEVLTQQVNQLKQQLIDLDLEHEDQFGTGN